MSSGRLRRTYRLAGLDRVLYSTPPAWEVGTFEQSVEDEGQLVLQLDDLSTPGAAELGLLQLDEIATQFRLAISKRIGRPLTLKLISSEEPDFGGSDMLVLSSAVGMSSVAGVTISPRDPPTQIEQIAVGAERWVATVAETAHFSDYPDEIVKRNYLLIEELGSEHGSVLSADLAASMDKAKWVRDFVSHPICGNPALCAFIAQELPSAVVSSDPLKVRFDRSSLEHRNFVGRLQPLIERIANALVDAAIHTL